AETTPAVSAMRSGTTDCSPCTADARAQSCRAGAALPPRAPAKMAARRGRFRERELSWSAPSAAQINPLGDLRHVLVAAAPETEEHGLVGLARSALRADPENRMRCLQRRDDSLVTGEQIHAPQGVVIAHRHVFGATGILQPRVFGTDAGIIQAGTDRMRRMH